MDSLPEKAYDIWVDNRIQFTVRNGGRNTGKRAE